MAESASTFASAGRTAAEGLRTAEAVVDDAMTGFNDKLDEARNAWSDLERQVRKAVLERPYTALAIAGAVGFLYAVARR